MPKIRKDPRLRAEMGRDGIDLLLAFSMENVSYLSGAPFSLQDNIRERLSVAGFAAAGSDFLLCAGNEASAVEPTCHSMRFGTCVEFEPAPIAALASLLQAAVASCAAAGIPGYRRDQVGHRRSVLGGHDNPMLHASNSQPLAVGMVIAFEPIPRNPAGRRFTVEDTFAIGAPDIALLTTATDTTSMVVTC